MSPNTPLLPALALGILLASLLVPRPAEAGKVHWKEDPAMPTCAALAFDDTDEWFGTTEGVAFKKGVCHGQRIRYSVVLAPDGQSFTASGTNVCRYRVGDAHAISVKCLPAR